MRKSLAILVLALAAFGCSKKEEKPEGAKEAPAAGAPAAGQQQQQQGQAAEEKQEPSEKEMRIERVTKALGDAGLGPKGDETLPTRLGNRPECSPTERRRYNLEGEEMYVIVGTYADEAAATACMDAYQKFLGGMWEQFKADFYRDGRFVIELNPKMPAEQKEKARKAVAGSLG
ncbi:hypothetical protein [Vulgatibacter sp.]|uniref:hypothetical protein n=1 Tax=Vulgatibacter sp. TaxID=1971226 RepID=UPI00356419B6